MSKHTAGPWRVTNDTDIVGVENDPENMCAGDVDVAHVYLRVVEGRTNANARLIAAAPDLLLLMQEVVNKNLLAGSILSDAKAAIAKATGEQ